jgi:hypothetical protein
MQIVRHVTDCPSPFDLIEKQLDCEPVELNLGERGKLTVHIDSHQETGDSQYLFTGRVVDTGTPFELGCWHYGIGTDGTIEFDDDQPDHYVELAEAYPGL